MVLQERLDLGFAGELGGGIEVAEEASDVRGFEVDAFDLVVGTTAFDGGPIDDGSAAGDGVAHVGLLEDFIESGTGAAIFEELFPGESGATGAVNKFDQAQFDGIDDGDAVIEVPGRLAGASLLDKLVEEGVLAFMGGPDGHIVAPGHAALGGLPEELGVGMFGEFVDTDIAAVNRHGLGMSGESDDARAVVEFDIADFDFFLERSWAAIRTDTIYLKEVFAVRNDGASEFEEVSKLVGKAHVFDGAGIIFGGQKIIAFREAETFANIFEGVAVSPADPNGLFADGEDLFFLSVEFVLAEDPGDLLSHEVLRKHGI